MLILVSQFNFLSAQNSKAKKLLLERPALDIKYYSEESGFTEKKSENDQSQQNLYVTNLDEIRDYFSASSYQYTLPKGNEMPLYDFYRDNGDWWFARSEDIIHSYSGQVNSRSHMGQASLGDSDDSSEYNQHTCYKLKWGDIYLKGDQTIQMSDLHTLLTGRFLIEQKQKSRSCKSIKKYKYRIVFVMPDHDIIAYQMDNNSGQQDFERVYKKMSGQLHNIYVEDIQINKKTHLPPFVIRVVHDEATSSF